MRLRSTLVWTDREKNAFFDEIDGLGGGRGGGGVQKGIVLETSTLLRSSDY